MSFKHMYMTPLSYENFAGKQRTTKLYFHLTPRELADWAVENKDLADRLQMDFEGMSETMASDVDGEMTEAQKLGLLRLIKVVAEISNGVPDEDGEIFDKSGINKFVHSAAYDAFRLFLFTNPKELNQFMETLLNAEAIGELNTALQGQREESEVVKSTATTKGPKSRDEVLELMRAHGIQPAE